MLITSLLIIGSIIVRGMSTCGIQVPNWIENTTTYVGSNRVGQLLLTKHLIERVSATCDYFHKILLILHAFYFREFTANAQQRKRYR